MQVIQPSQTLNQNTQNVSVASALNGNVSPGNGLTFDSNGQPLTYQQDNMVGIILRVAATGNAVKAPQSWVAANTDLTIQHNLNAVPYGYIVIAKSKTCDVYWGSIQPTAMAITLRITDASADTTIWILC